MLWDDVCYTEHGDLGPKMGKKERCDPLPGSVSSENSAKRLIFE